MSEDTLKHVALVSDNAHEHVKNRFITARQWITQGVITILQGNHSIIHEALSRKRLAVSLNDLAEWYLSMHIDPDRETYGSRYNQVLTAMYNTVLFDYARSGQWVKGFLPVTMREGSTQVIPIIYLPNLPVQGLDQTAFVTAMQQYSKYWDQLEAEEQDYE